MSGPKVVRIVTREEVEAICRSLLRPVDAAFDVLRSCAERNGTWTGEYQITITLRRQALQRLFENAQWLDVQKQAPAELAFLGRESDRLTAEALDAEQVAQRRRRQLGDAARSAAMAFEDTGREVPTALLNAIDQAYTAVPEEFVEIERQLKDALSLLARPLAQSEMSDSHRDLAARLAAGESDSSYAEWLEAQASSDTQTQQRLDRLLGELYLFGDERAATFAARAQRIVIDRSEDRRALLTDSLVIDIADHVNKARTWRSVLPSLLNARDTLESLSPSEAEELIGLTANAIATENSAQATAVISATSQLAANKARRVAADARRRAVLQGLASLGYEIRETMATAWAQAGRIVVKKPGTVDYGVELGAVADAERMQVRLVGSANPSEPRTSARDRDAEAEWCSQVGDLGRAMAAAGSELVIERALPVGAQLVKTVEFEIDNRGTTSRIAAPKKRRLP